MPGVDRPIESSSWWRISTHLVRERAGVVVKRLAQVDQELLDALGGAVVAFDLALPAPLGGIGSKGVLNLAPGS